MPRRAGMPTHHTWFFALVTVVVAFSLAACSATRTASSPISQGAPPSSSYLPTSSPAIAGYPDRPIAYLVPWSPGGPLGTAATIMSGFLERELGQPIQILYRPGASGQVGLTEFVSTAKPDGYHLAGLVSPTTESTYLDPERRAIYSRKSFAPVAALSQDPNCFAVRSDSRFASLDELLEQARSAPESIVSADGGLMSDDHLTLLLLQKKAGVRFAMTHFEGGAPTQTALYGGHVDLMVGNVGDVLSASREGTFRVLGVAAEGRHRMLPNVPTLREQGIDMISLVVRGTVAPAGTPPEILRKLEQAMSAVDNLPEFRQRMDDAGLPAGFMGSEEYDRYLHTEEDEVDHLLSELRYGS